MLGLCSSISFVGAGILLGPVARSAISFVGAGVSAGLAVGFALSFSGFAIGSAISFVVVGVSCVSFGSR